MCDSISTGIIPCGVVYAKAARFKYSTSSPASAGIADMVDHDVEGRPVISKSLTISQTLRTQISSLKSTRTQNYYHNLTLCRWTRTRISEYHPGDELTRPFSLPLR